MTESLNEGFNRRSGAPPPRGLAVAKSQSLS